MSLNFDYKLICICENFINLYQMANRLNCYVRDLDSVIKWNLKQRLKLQPSRNALNPTVLPPSSSQLVVEAFPKLYKNKKSAFSRNYFL